MDLSGMPTREATKVVPQDPARNVLGFLVGDTSEAEANVVDAAQFRGPLA
jgi:hypothetical protein